MVFIGEIGFGERTNFGLTLVLSLFGLILSAIGFLTVVALSLGHQNYIMNIVTILKEWNATKFYKDYEKPVHYKIVHRWFFEIAISLFLVLSLFFVSQIYTFPKSLLGPLFLLVVGIITIIVIKALFRLTWQKAFDSRSQFIEREYKCFWKEIPYKGSWKSRMFPWIFRKRKKTKKIRQEKKERIENCL